MLLSAVEVRPVQDLIWTRTISLFKQIYNVTHQPEPWTCIFYIATGNITNGSLLSRIIGQGASPLSVIYNTLDTPKAAIMDENNGVVDSLRLLLHSENYIKPWSVEHHIVKLLTRCF